MKKFEGILGSALFLGLLLGASAALAAETLDEPRILSAEAAWQGPERAKADGRSARGDEDRGEEGRGEARRTQSRSGGSRDLARATPGQGNDARGNARGNQGNQGSQGRGNDNARPQGNQGRGNADARPQANQGRGNARDDDAARGRSGSGSPGRSGAARARRPDRPNADEVRAHIGRLPDSMRRLVQSSRRSEGLAGRALARASLRGTAPDRFRVENDASRVRVLNRNGVVLLDMSDEHARNLGHWEMRRLGDRPPTSGSPAFCRSGAGHPVWGREWCLDKGFGLGVGERSIWSRSTIDDVIFKRRPEAQITLDRGGLIEVLGDIVLGRLAVQSLALGYDEPLVGRWVYTPQEPQAPWILRVNAGDVAVAEFVDADRDSDVDVLYVSQARW